jgi:hypothetical protein
LYSREFWGLTARNGPGDLTRKVGTVAHKLATYAARGPAHLPDGYNDGTIALTAMVGPIAFPQEIVTLGFATPRHNYGNRNYGKYGFYDAFNLIFRFTEVPVEFGKVDLQLV